MVWIICAIAALVLVYIAATSRHIGQAIILGLLGIIIGGGTLVAGVLVGIGTIAFGIEGLFLTLFEGAYGMLHPILLLDGLFLWGALALAAIVALIAIEHKAPWWSTFVVALTLVGLELYSAWHPITFAIQHPLDALVAVAAYLGVGVVWIIVKWFSHVYSVRDKFLEVKDQLTKDIIDASRGSTTLSNLATEVNGVWTLTDEGIRKLYLNAAFCIGEASLPLKVSQHKTELYMWWIWWPLSLFWTLINDPLRRIWDFIYNTVGGLLQRISDRAFKLTP